MTDLRHDPATVAADPRARAGARRDAVRADQPARGADPGRRTVARRCPRGPAGDGSVRRNRQRAGRCADDVGDRLLPRQRARRDAGDRHLPLLPSGRGGARRRADIAADPRRPQSGCSIRSPSARASAGSTPGRPNQPAGGTTSRPGRCVRWRCSTRSASCGESAIPPRRRPSSSRPSATRVRRFRQIEARSELFGVCDDVGDLTATKDTDHAGDRSVLRRLRRHRRRRLRRRHRRLPIRRRCHRYPSRQRRCRG